MKIKILILLTLISLLSGCSSQKEDNFPPELTGLWKTKEPRYDGCSFEISPTRIIFSNMHEDYSGINSIRSIEKSQEGGQTTYNIEYENREGLVYKTSLVYVKSGNTEITYFKNQKDVKWTKEDAPG